MIEKKHIKVLDAIKSNPSLSNRLEKSTLTTFPNKRKVISNRLRLGDYVDREVILKHISYVKTLKVLEDQYFKIGKITFKMISCPSAILETDDGKTQHQNLFLLGETEVTQELFEKVMGFNPSHNKGKKNPVETVSRLDATTFCNKLSKMNGIEPYYEIDRKTNTITLNPQSDGFRLPTENEWYYAAKAGYAPRHFPWKWNELESAIDYVVCDPNYHGSSNLKTKPVKSKWSNCWGFYDMYGNVEEWIIDGNQMGASFETCYLELPYMPTKYITDQTNLVYDISHEFEHSKRKEVGFRICKYVLPKGYYTTKKKISDFTYEPN